jgi:hypothetical protein
MCIKNILRITYCALALINKGIGLILNSWRYEMKEHNDVKVHTIVFSFQTSTNVPVTHVNMEATALTIWASTHAHVPVDMRDLSVKRVSLTKNYLDMLLGEYLNMGRQFVNYNDVVHIVWLGNRNVVNILKGHGLICVITGNSRKWDMLRPCKATLNIICKNIIHKTTWYTLKRTNMVPY